VGEAEASAPKLEPKLDPKVEPEDDMRVDMVQRVMPVVAAFIKWSASHQGAPCPSAKELEPLVGGAAKLHDSWGRAMTITCTDQPAQQAIGIVSAGPDGVLGTLDDVASWTLGNEVTNLLSGPRWVVKQVRPKPAPPKRPRTGSAAEPVDRDGDGIPDDR
jgi:hypothetical protein